MAAGTCKVRLPELRLGLPLQPLSFEILRASSGATLLPLLMNGRRAPVQELAAHGLAEVVADERVLPQAIAAAHRLAASDATTFALAKQQRWRPVLKATVASAETEIEVRSVWERADLSVILRRVAAPARSSGASR